MLTSKQRAFLRGQAQNLNAIFQLGKTGISQESVKAVADALARREIVKLHVLETCPYNAKEAAPVLAEAVKCDVVQVIGSKIVLFKKKNKDSKYDLKNLTVL